MQISLIQCVCALTEYSPTQPLPQVDSSAGQKLPRKQHSVIWTEGLREKAAPAFKN